MNATTAHASELAGKAMRAIDEAIAKKPERDGHAFSAAVRCLAELRDALLREQRDLRPSRHPQDKLARLNAVISVIVGGHYPIGSVPWRHVEEARSSFAEILAELENDARRTAD